MRIRGQGIIQRPEPGIAKIPDHFKLPHLFQYPEDNKEYFEYWYLRNYDNATDKRDRIYLPILWTSYLCRANYGTDSKKIQALQNLVDSLDRSKRYYVVVQYDDGPMVDFKDLDVKVFGMSGGRVDYPLPLLCQPHKYQFPNIKKDIFCSFVGSNTHPIRKELVKNLSGKHGYFVSMKKHSLEEYCKILARSVFALSPRGYGPSSFRCQESINYSAIPVYVSDHHILPYNEPFPGILTNDIPGIRKLLSESNVGVLRAQIESAKPLYTYEGCKKKILENI